MKVSKTAVPALVLVLCGSAASAQSRERFVEALVDLSLAVDGTYGDEGAGVIASIDAMAVRLAAWDRAVAAAESRFAQELGTAPPDARAQMHASLGLVYLDRGRLADGARELEASSRIAQNPDVDALRALALLRMGQSAAAARSAEAAWRLKRTDPALAALVLHTATDYEGAAAREALELLRAQRARLLQARSPGAPPFTSISLLDDSAAPQPVLAPAAYGRGYASIARGEYAEAVEYFRAAARADPLVTAPADAAGTAALRRGDTAGAVTLLSAAIARAPQSSEAHRLLGAAFLANREPAAAIPQFEAAIRLAPRDDRARLALAEALTAVGQPARAEQTLLQAGTLDGSSGPLHLQLAALYQEAQREADALRAFEAVAAAAPLAGAARVWVSIGRLRENQLDADGAVTAFRRAIELDPNSTAARRELGEVLRSLGALEQARAAYAAALLIDPLDAESWTGVAQLDAAGQKHEDALAAADRAIELNPRNAEAHYARAQALQRLDRRDEADAALDIFRTLQAEAMEQQRRMYERSLRAIEAELQKQPGDAR